MALPDAEPLIHFALNCGAKGCPPIKTYTPQVSWFHKYFAKFICFFDTVIDASAAVSQMRNDLSLIKLNLLNNAVNHNNWYASNIILYNITGTD